MKAKKRKIDFQFFSFFFEKEIKKIESKKIRLNSFLSNYSESKFYFFIREFLIFFSRNLKKNCF